MTSKPRTIKLTNKAGAETVVEVPADCTTFKVPRDTVAVAVALPQESAASAGSDRSDMGKEGESHGH